MQGLRDLRQRAPVRLVVDGGRECDPEHLARVLRVACAHATLELSLTTPFTYISKVIGTARVLSDGICNAYVVDVWTLTPYRRRGVARRMLEILLEPLRGQHVALFTDEAPEFYRKLGFRERGVTFEKVIGRWLDPDS